MFDRTNRTLICSVVFLDIVEYSRQPVSEQMLLKERFNALLHDAMQDIAVNDRIMLDTGDGAAISFLGDPEDVLFVVMNLRDTCKEMATSGQPLGLRIGINLGPVKLVKDINGRPNLIGDGINVAQRIMGFAEPGQVMVSRSFFEVVSCLSDEYARLFNYEGPRTDKHVREHEVYAVGYSEQVPHVPSGRRRNGRHVLPQAGSRQDRRASLARRAAVAGGAVALLGAGWLGFAHWGAGSTSGNTSAISAFKTIDAPGALPALAAGQAPPQPPSGIPLNNTPPLKLPVATAAPVAAPATNTLAPAPMPNVPLALAAKPTAGGPPVAASVAPAVHSENSSTKAPPPAKEHASSHTAKAKPSTPPKPSTHTPIPTEAPQADKPKPCPTLECWPGGRPKHDR
jgi:hypothetical protein